jgi:nitrogen fixation protein NifU and related proteins
MDRQAYIEFLLDHYQNPRNKGRVEDADVVVSGGNPGCGDVVTLFIKAGGDDEISSVHFDGEGCTISMAGASIIAEIAGGRPAQDFEVMGYEEIVELMGKDIVMSRVKCATVGLGTLKAGLKQLRHKRKMESLDNRS